MPVTATCPSCGAAVRFQSAGSVLAVCGYCRSTLAREGDALKNLGRMAELLPDDSPLQLGSTGRWKDQAFAVVGRLQMRHEAGFWNEWHILFEDGRSGWLGEAGGQWTVTLPAPWPPGAPDFAALGPGARVEINGQHFEVSNREEAVCLSGEGELPFLVGAGYIAPVVDLRAGRAFATLDFSGKPPQAYVGEAVEGGELALAQLRDRESAALAVAPGGKADALSCPACGAPWALHDQAILAMACPACGALSDIDGPVARVREAARMAQRITPPLPLGSRGTLGGRAWEVIGYMRKTVPQDIGTWDEYLLYDGAGTFAWLASERGHWNFIRQLNTRPTQTSGGDKPVVTHGGQRYLHFATYTGEVVAVLGEFTWRVKVGEQVEVIDYVAPPKVLSRERSVGEITWSAGEYVPHHEVSAAFGLARPLGPPRGVNACQPNPHTGPRNLMLVLALVFAVAAVAIHAVFSGAAQRELFRAEVPLVPGQEVAYTSEPFRLTGALKRVELGHYTGLDNAWVQVETELVHRDTGQIYTAAHEIAYYSGYDADGGWSEGRQDAGAVFYGLPEGEYHLAVRGELAPEQGRELADVVTLRAASAPLSNLLVCLLVLAALPLFAWMRSGAFEVARWAESDHPIGQSSDGDDE